MKQLLRLCQNCIQYTLKKNCPMCNSETISPHPPKFSLDDKYIRYRIKERYSDNK